MERSTVLIVKFDGILINTVEVFSKRIWQIIDNLGLAREQAVDSQVNSQIDNLVVMNWDKGASFLAYNICKKLDSIGSLTEFKKRLINIDYDMVGTFRLNRSRLEIIEKLSNADFMTALYTNRSMENFQYIARMVGLNYLPFNYILTKDIVSSSISQWFKNEEIDAKLVYFGNTTGDADLISQEDSVVILPDFQKEEIIESDFFIEYLENNFLKSRKFNPLTAVAVKIS